MADESIILSRHTYSWLARHRGVKKGINVSIFATIVGCILIFVHKTPLDKTHPIALLDIFLVAIALGYVLDIFSRVTKVFHNLAITDKGIIFYLRGGQEEVVLWDEITSIDEFDIRDSKDDDKKVKASDYTKAMGVSGLRIITSSNKKYCIYRSISGYKELKDTVISKCLGAKRFENSSELT